MTWETKVKRNRAKEEPLGKLGGREESGKVHDEQEPRGANDLAVPDYVMRDFEEHPGEGTERSENTP